MKITVLADNNTLIGKYFIGEPGLSFYIEANDKKILFDTGYSDTFIKNAQKMDIDLKKLDYIVFSHGHYDHTWGLSSLIKLYTETKSGGSRYNNPEILTHPFTFLSKSDERFDEFGSLLSEAKLSKIFNLQLTKKAFKITEKLTYLGEIPRNNEFEGKSPLGKVNFETHEEDDYIIEDSALVYKSELGLVIITGCSHSGICNIIDYAKKVCNEERILDIIGGFHLSHSSGEKLTKTVDYFKKVKPKQIHPCHCTDLHSKIELSRCVNVKEVGVGLKLEY